MCRNDNDADDAELQPFVMTTGDPVATTITSPASRTAALHEDTNSSSRSIDGTARLENNESLLRTKTHGICKNVIVTVLIGVCMLGGSFWSGMRIAQPASSVVGDRNRLVISSGGGARDNKYQEDSSGMLRTSMEHHDDEVVSIESAASNTDHEPRPMHHNGHAKEKKSQSHHHHNDDDQDYDDHNDHHNNNNNNNDNRRNDKLSRTDLALLSYLSKSSFGRDKVINLIVNEYTSPLGPEKLLKDRLDNAIEAIQVSETDGDPVPIKGHPFMYVGSVGAAVNRESLLRNEITHVINWSSTAKCDSFRYTDGIQYLCFAGIRNYTQLLHHVDYVDRAVEFIESARKRGGRAMSHCWYGRNRSVTALAAYLMKYEGYGAEEATELIRRTRPIADPYRDVLRRYKREYIISSTRDEEGSDGGNKVSKEKRKADGGG